MPDANVAANESPAGSKLITELKVSGHLMTLDSGLYCIVLMPSRAMDMAAGLPGIRLSLPPGPMNRPESIQITTFRPDGYLHGFGDAGLVRVLNGPAQLLVTIYQSATTPEGGAPNVQVTRLLELAPPGAAPTQPRGQAPAPAPQHGAGRQAPRVMDMVAHIMESGDVGAMLGDWLGERGSKRWIEGFAIAPTQGVGISPRDIEYQAVLGRGWLSPWVEGGQFCGSRGMALPILGLRLRLRGAAADTHEALYAATFVDGSQVGPVPGGEACEAESLAAMESFQVVIRPRGAGAAAAAEEEDAAGKGKKPAARKPKKA
jgi:hypothetical protein